MHRPVTCPSNRSRDARRRPVVAATAGVRGPGAPGALLRVALQAALQCLAYLVDTEARLPLARGVFLEGLEELADQRGHAEHRSGTVGHHPVVVGVARDVGPLVGVGAEVEDLWETQRCERLSPDAQCPGDTLLREDDLPVPAP